MAKREKVQRSGEFVLFDVLYEDGTRSSNRKVPSSELGSLDGDTPAKPYIEAQDRKIAAVSGKPRGPIRSVSRSSMR
jgi:hypothetical protein